MGSFSVRPVLSHFPPFSGLMNCSLFLSPSAFSFSPVHHFTLLCSLVSRLCTW
jgi:hypothetical protein